MLLNKAHFKTDVNTEPVRNFVKQVDYFVVVKVCF